MPMLTHQDDCSALKGVGQKKRALLSAFGIETIMDMLYFFPRTWEDRRGHVRVSDLKEGKPAGFTAKVISIRKPVRNSSSGKKLPLVVTVGDGSGTIEIVFFSARYMDRIFTVGSEFYFYGEPTVGYGKMNIVHPEFERTSGPDFKAVPIMPVYPLKAGLTQLDMRRWHKEAIEAVSIIEDFLPTTLIENLKLCNLAYALQNIHYPEGKHALSAARYRLIFDELFLLAAALGLLRNTQGTNRKGIAFAKNITPAAFSKHLKFEMTEAQARSVKEIYDDMESSFRMNRLVQGDVGSGKTAVAMAAVYKAVGTGCQAVMMAPTEILAAQHYEEFKSVLGAKEALINTLPTSEPLISPLSASEPLEIPPVFLREPSLTETKSEALPQTSINQCFLNSEVGMEIRLLTASVRPAERREILAGFASGEIDLLIGTHALLQPDVIPSRLGLVITDEQHRFGVNQRIGLSEKGGEEPDILVMTATPIPRTLAFILYGDLDVSIIDQLPPGRKPVETKAVSSAGRSKAYSFAEAQMTLGHQVYVVCPLIEENAESEVMANVRSISSVYEELAQRFKNRRIAMLHGAMPQAEKDKIMGEFVLGNIDMLVSTVVIEVGINVPNATLMVIENAERFGLAQLHQLRGRVGRGSGTSTCILISDSQSEDAQQRMRLMTETSDGFVIAEQDLVMRGPGEFFGIRQHGLPELKISDITKNASMLTTVKDAVTTLLAADPRLEKQENILLRRHLEATVSGLSNPGL